MNATLIRKWRAADHAGLDQGNLRQVGRLSTGWPPLDYRVAMGGTAFVLLMAAEIVFIRVGQQADEGLDGRRRWMAPALGFFAQAVGCAFLLIHGGPFAINGPSCPFGSSPDDLHV